MTNIDEFESLFKAADKPVFHIEPLSFQTVAVVLDVESGIAEEWLNRVRQFFGLVRNDSNAFNLEIVADDRFSTCSQLMDVLKGTSADLVCTHRNLNGHSAGEPYSLGEYVDVMTQVAEIPILLVPRYDEDNDHALAEARHVMMMTDHLAGDDRLVSHALNFTQPGGELIFAHVEDEQTFDRYINVISKIPDIDTEIAKQEIMEQLLKEPREFIDSCAAGIQLGGFPVKTRPIVTIGHHLTDYKNLIYENHVDVLVMNTKDEDQLAMHGLAYPIAVELRDIPMLLI